MNGNLAKRKRDCERPATPKEHTEQSRLVDVLWVTSGDVFIQVFFSFSMKCRASKGNLNKIESWWPPAYPMCKVPVFNTASHQAVI